MMRNGIYEQVGLFGSVGLCALLDAEWQERLIDINICSGFVRGCNNVGAVAGFALANFSGCNNYSSVYGNGEYVRRFSGGFR